MTSLHLSGVRKTSKTTIHKCIYGYTTISHSHTHMFGLIFILSTSSNSNIIVRSRMWVCVSYLWNVEICLWLHVRVRHRHAHHHDDHGGPHGCVWKERTDGRSGQVETGRLTRVNWGRWADPGTEESGRACGSVCFSSDPPTRSPANHCEASGNTGQVFWTCPSKTTLNIDSNSGICVCVFAFVVC